jgi:hypothetical protein
MLVLMAEAAGFTEAAASMAAVSTLAVSMAVASMAAVSMLAVSMLAVSMLAVSTVGFTPAGLVFWDFPIIPILMEGIIIPTTAMTPASPPPRRLGTIAPIRRVITRT